jgi:DNA-binding CsgD family transcriptional regulator
VDARDFVAGGIRKIVTIVKPSQVPHLALTHAAFVQQARAKDFDPRTVQYLEFAWTATGKIENLPLLSTAVVLNYTEARDLAWTVMFEIKDGDGALETLASCKRILRLIKERHNQIYLHPSTHVVSLPGPIQFINPLVEKITVRELEVLRLLAKGCSTVEIAERLSIAANTVETHRKKLLEKFHAKNVAELIKMASKVYWLE